MTTFIKQVKVTRVASWIILWSILMQLDQYGLLCLKSGSAKSIGGNIRNSCENLLDCHPLSRCLEKCSDLKIFHNIWNFNSPLGGFIALFSQIFSSTNSEKGREIGMKDEQGEDMFWMKYVEASVVAAQSAGWQVQLLHQVDPSQAFLIRKDYGLEELVEILLAAVVTSRLVVILKFSIDAAMTTRSLTLRKTCFWSRGWMGEPDEGIVGFGMKPEM